MDYNFDSPCCRIWSFSGVWGGCICFTELPSSALKIGAYLNTMLQKLSHTGGDILVGPDHEFLPPYSNWALLQV